MTLAARLARLKARGFSVTQEVLEGTAIVRVTAVRESLTVEASRKSLHDACLAVVATAEVLERAGVSHGQKAV